MLRKTPLRSRPKPKSAIHRRHHERVAGMECCACGAEGVEVHHSIFDGRGRITRNHELVVPLCTDHHRLAPGAVHVLGERAFNQMHDINLYERAMRLWSETCESS